MGPIAKIVEFSHVNDIEVWQFQQAWLWEVGCNFGGHSLIQFRGTGTLPGFSSKLELQQPPIGRGWDKFLGGQQQELPAVA